MRKLSLLLLCFVLVLSYTGVNAQFDIGKKIKKKVKQRTDRKVDKGIDEGLDEVEEGMKGEGNDDEPSTEEPSTDNESSGVKESSNSKEGEESSINNSENKKLKAYSKYDFMRGDKGTIFYDDQHNEENGEFPSRWDALGGNVENAVLGKDKVIRFVTNGSAITPLVTEGKYLPDAFTIEFDAFFDGEKNHHWQHYMVRLWFGENRWDLKTPEVKELHPIKIMWGSAQMGTFKTTLAKEHVPEGQGWRHIAMSYNDGAFKMYIDEFRVLNIPRLNGKPQAITIQGNFWDMNGKLPRTSAIKNVSINRGAKPKYNAIYEDVVNTGKYVAPILFEYDKAAIKPESMGIINNVAKMMKEHPDLNISIEGHTDSDGEADYNQNLSEIRASAVMQNLVEAGIDNSRLRFKGLGETQPVNNNNTAEAKAENRRVEFVAVSK